MTLEEAREDLLLQAKLDVDLYKGVEIDSEGNYREESEGATDLISRACIWWSKLTYCNYDPSVTLTLTIGTDTYDCRNRNLVSAKVLKPRIVVINDSTLYRCDGRQYGLWTMAELQRFHPSWRTYDDGLPSRAVWLPTNKLLLSVPPAGVYTGKNYIEAWTLPDPLVQGEDDGSELPVPEEDHQSIIRLALEFGTLPNASEEEAWRRINGNASWWREQAERRKRENLNAFLGRRPRGKAADWLY